VTESLARRAVEQAAAEAGLAITFVERTAAQVTVEMPAERIRRGVPRDEAFKQHREMEARLQLVFVKNSWTIN
jgi:hypothetical protein